MARIIGTNEDDVLNHTSRGRDIIYGLDGDDEIHFSQSDTVIGGAGGDSFFVSGLSDDYVLSYATSEEPLTFKFYNNEDAPSGEQVAQLDVSGGDADGDQLIVGEYGDHVSQKLGVIGTDGDDYFEGEISAVEGGGGADTINFDFRDIFPSSYSRYAPTVAYGSSPEAIYFDQDSMIGYGGDAEGDEISFADDSELRDLNIRGSNHDDLLIGGEERGGTLFGAGGDDMMIGRGGDNAMSGDSGNDTLMGRAGDDFLTGGSGADFLDGGSGQDTVSYQTSAEGVHIDLGAGIAEGGDADGDVLTDVEGIFGTSHNDLLIGDEQDNNIDGYFGYDTIYGNGGDDTLTGITAYGGDGNDTLSGSEYGQPDRDYLYGDGGDDTILGNEGGDRLYGGEGSDTVLAGYTYYGDDLFPPDGTHADGGDGDDIVKGNNADDFLYGGTGDDLMEGGLGDDAMYGGDGQDILRGGQWEDLLSGGAGRDLLEGGRDDDRMLGQDGHDVLRGEHGEDLLFGGDGNDLLTGGQSSDSFVWATFEGGAERDRITDFEAGENGDRFLLGKTFQEKSGIDDFGDFINHAEQNDTGVYVDFSGGRHYSYGVQIDGIEIGDLVADNVVFDVDDYGTL